MKYNILYFQEKESELVGGTGQTGQANDGNQPDDNSLMPKATSAVEKAVYIQKGRVGVFIDDEEYEAFKKVAENNEEAKKIKPFVDQAYEAGKQIGSEKGLYFLEDPEYRSALKYEMDKSFLVNSKLVNTVQQFNPDVSLGDEQTVNFYKKYGNEILNVGFEAIRSFSDYDLGISDFSLVTQAADMLSSEASAAAVASEIYLGGKYTDAKYKERLVNGLTDKGFVEGQDFIIDKDKVIINLPAHDERRGDFLESIYDEFGEDAVMWSLDRDEFDESIFYGNSSYSSLGRSTGVLPNGLTHYEGRVVLGLADEKTVGYRGYADAKEAAWQKNYISGEDIRFDQSKEKDVFSHWWRSLTKAFDEGTDLFTNFVIAERVSSFMEGKGDKDASFIDTYGYFNYINNLETTFFQTEKELNKHPLSLYSLHGVMGDFTGQMLPEIPLMFLSGGVSKAASSTVRGVAKIASMAARGVFSSSKIAFRGIKAARNVGRLARLGNIARGAGYSMLRGGVNLGKAGAKKSIETLTNLGILHGAAYAASSAYSEARRMGLGIDVSTDVALVAGGAVLGSEVVLGSMATNFTRRLMGGYSSYEEKIFDQEFSKAMKTWVGDIVSAPGGKVSPKAGAKLLGVLENTIGKIQSWGDNTFLGGTITNALSEASQETFEELINLYGKEMIEDKYGLSDETFVFDTSDLFTHVTLSIFFGSLPMGALTSGITNLRKNINSNFRLSRDSNASLDSFIVSSILNGKTDLLLKSIDKMKKDKVFGTYTKGKAIPHGFKGDVNDFYADVFKQQIGLYSAIIKQEKNNIDRNDAYLDNLFDKAISKAREINHSLLERGLEERMKAMDEAAMPLAKSLKQAVKDKDVSRMALLTAALEHEHRKFSELAVANGVMMIYNRRRPPENHQAVVEHIYTHNKQKYVFNPVKKQWELYNPSRHVLLSEFDYKKAIDQIEISELNAGDRIMIDAIKESINKIDELREKVLVSEISAIINVSNYFRDKGGRELADIDYLSSIYGIDNVGRALTRIVEALINNRDIVSEDEAYTLSDVLNQLQDGRVSSGKVKKAMSAIIDFLKDKVETTPGLGRELKGILKKIGVLRPNVHAEAMALSRELEKRGDLTGKEDDFYSFIFHSLSSMAAVTAIAPFSSANYVHKLSSISSMNKKVYYSYALHESFYYDPEAVAERMSQVSKKDKDIKEKTRKDSEKLSEKAKEVEGLLSKIEEASTKTQDTSKVEGKAEEGQEGKAEEEGTEDTKEKELEEVKKEIQDAAKKLSKQEEPSAEGEPGKEGTEGSEGKDEAEEVKKEVEKGKKEVEKEISNKSSEIDKAKQEVSGTLEKVKKVVNQRIAEIKESVMNDLMEAADASAIASAVYKAKHLIGDENLTEEEKQIVSEAEDKLWQQGITIGAVPPTIDSIESYEVVEEVENPEIAALLEEGRYAVVGVDTPPMMSGGNLMSKGKIRVIRGTGKKTDPKVFDIINDLRRGIPLNNIRVKIEAINAMAKIKELEDELEALNRKKEALTEKQKAFSSYEKSFSKLVELTEGLDKPFIDLDETALEGIGVIISELDEETLSVLLGESNMDKALFLKKRWQEFVAQNTDASFSDFYSSLSAEYRDRTVFYSFKPSIEELSYGLVQGVGKDALISSLKRRRLNETVKAISEVYDALSEESRRKVGHLLKIVFFGPDGFNYKALNPLTYLPARLSKIEGLNIKEHGAIMTIGKALIADLSSAGKGEDLSKTFNELRTIEMQIENLEGDTSIQAEEQELLEKIKEKEEEVLSLSRLSSEWDEKWRTKWLDTADARRIGVLSSRAEEILEQIATLIERINATSDAEVRMALEGQIDRLQAEADSIIREIEDIRSRKKELIIDDQAVSEAKENIDAVLRAMDELQSLYDQYYDAVRRRQREEKRINELKMKKMELEKKGVHLLKLINEGSEDMVSQSILMNEALTLIDKYVEGASNIEGEFSIEVQDIPLFRELLMFGSILSSYDSSEAKSLLKALGDIASGLKKGFSLLYNETSKEKGYIKAEDVSSMLSGLNELKAKAEEAENYFRGGSKYLASMAKESLARLKSVVEFERMRIMSELLVAKIEQEQGDVDKEINELEKRKAELTNKLSEVESAIAGEFEKIDSVKENLGEEAYKQALEALTPLETQQAALQKEIQEIDELIVQKQNERDNKKIDEIVAIEERLSLLAESLLGWMKEDEFYGPMNAYEKMVSGKIWENIFIMVNAPNVYKSIVALKEVNPDVAEIIDYNPDQFFGILEELHTVYGDGRRELMWNADKFVIKDEPDNLAESLLRVMYNKYKKQRFADIDKKIEAIANGKTISEPLLDTLHEVIGVFENSNALDNIERIGDVLSEAESAIKEMVETYNPSYINTTTLINLIILYQYINKTGSFKEVLGIDISDRLRFVLSNAKVREIELMAEFMGKSYEAVMSHFYLALKDVVQRVGGVVVPVDFLPIDESVLGSISIEEVELAIDALNNHIVGEMVSGLDTESLSDISIAYALRDIFVAMKPYLSKEMDVILMASKEKSAQIKDFYNEQDRGVSTAQLKADDKEATYANVELDLLESVTKGGLTLKNKRGGVSKSATRDVLFSIERHDTSGKEKIVVPYGYFKNLLLEYYAEGLGSRKLKYMLTSEQEYMLFTLFNSLIRGNANEVDIIQAAAGSGKTSLVLTLFSIYDLHLGKAGQSKKIGVLTPFPRLLNKLKSEIDALSLKNIEVVLIDAYWGQYDPTLTVEEALKRANERYKDIKKETDSVDILYIDEMQGVPVNVLKSDVKIIATGDVAQTGIHARLWHKFVNNGAIDLDQYGVIAPMSNYQIVSNAVAARKKSAKDSDFSGKVFIPRLLSIRYRAGVVPLLRFLDAATLNVSTDTPSDGGLYIYLENTLNNMGEREYADTQGGVLGLKIIDTSDKKAFYDEAVSIIKANIKEGAMAMKEDASFIIYVEDLDAFKMATEGELPAAFIDDLYNAGFIYDHKSPLNINGIEVDYVYAQFNKDSTITKEEANTLFSRAKKGVALGMDSPSVTSTKKPVSSIQMISKRVDESRLGQVYDQIVDIWADELIDYEEGRYAESRIAKPVVESEVSTEKETSAGQEQDSATEEEGADSQSEEEIKSSETVSESANEEGEVYQKNNEPGQNLDEETISKIANAVSEAMSSINVETDVDKIKEILSNYETLAIYAALADYLKSSMLRTFDKYEGVVDKNVLDTQKRLIEEKTNVLIEEIKRMCGL